MAGSAAFGTKFYKMSGTSSTAIAYITNVSGPKLDTDDIDVTDHDDSDGIREFVPGLVDAGEVELELNYNKAQTAALYAMVRTTASFKVIYPDSSSWTFSGYLKGLESEAPHDDKIVAKANFKCSGSLTHATS